MASRGFADVPSQRPKAKTKAARKERRRKWRAQIGGAREQQKAIDELLSVEAKRPRRRPAHVPPDITLANQILAAEERVWRSTWARKLRRDGRYHWTANHPEAKWPDFRSYAATFAKPEWIVPVLDPKVLPDIRKQVQRQAKRLAPGHVVTGVIDFCWFRDDVVEVQGWAFHVHLTIQLVGAEKDPHLRTIKKAFPYKKAPERGVAKARVVVAAYDAPGWDHYQDKVFQAGAIRQRIVRQDLFGGRCKTHKPPQTKEQQLEVARFFQKIRASDLMIWVGHRRYGHQLRRMPCHRSNWENR